MLNGFYGSMMGTSGFPWLQMNLVWLLPLVILDLILKGFALWRAGKNNQPTWFVVLFIINSLGLLPAAYLLFFQKKKNS